MHFPVIFTWLHLLGYLFWQLSLNDWPPEAFDRTNMIIHLVAVASVGPAGCWIYSGAFQAPLWTDTALNANTSEASPETDEPE